MASSAPLLNRVFSSPFNSRPPSHHRTHHSTIHFRGTKPQRSARFTGHEPRKTKPIKIRALSYPSASGLEESVKKTISENPVVVYSKTWCPYSSEVKSLFKQIGEEPLVIELDELGPQGPQLQMVLETLSGQRTVPNVFIGGKHIGGCTETVDLHEKGELEPLLSEASARKTES